MPLLGSAAMLLSFDVESGAIDEHDEWHTHEHLPERLSIPGFLRGTRWVAARGGPRYMVVYEVESLATLTSPAYLERLNDPTPWTRKMMPHYRGMSRGLCEVIASFGAGQGGVSGLIRFKPDRDAIRWLREDALPKTPQMPGLGSAHLLQGAQPGAMTNEQRIRGADRGVDCALLLTGYDEAAIDERSKSLARHLGGLATDVTSASYRLAYSLQRAEKRGV